MLISFRGGKINYSDTGSGKVIVLIHGYLESMQVWESFANKLSENFRVVGIDMPGHGNSSLSGEENSMEMFALVIKAVLDSLSIKKAFLTGHSMGGYATLAFLEFFPEYLSGYLLFHSHPLKDMPDTIEKRKLSIGIVENGKKEEMIPGFVRGLYAPKNLDTLHEAVERSINIASMTDGKTIIADLKGMMARPDRTYLIESGKVPFLWILGTMDCHIDYQAIQQKVRLPENAQVVILKNSGHMGFIEEEDESLEVITQFAR